MNGQQTHKKMLSIGEMQIKITMTFLVPMSISEKQIITNVGENVKKTGNLKPSGGNVKQCSHFTYTQMFTEAVFTTARKWKQFIISRYIKVNI